MTSDAGNKLLNNRSRKKRDQAMQIRHIRGSPPGKCYLVDKQRPYWIANNKMQISLAENQTRSGKLVSRGTHRHADM